MNRPKVVIHSLLVEDPSLEMEILSKINAEVVFVPNDDQDKFFEEIKDADGVIIADRKIKPEHVDTMEKCKIIARQGIGFDNIELVKTKEKGMAVTNVPDYCVDEVSDYAMSLMLTMLRHIPTYNKHVREGIWDIKSIMTKSGFPQMRRLNTQTLGILGFGKIAREVARKSRAFGFRMITFDPYIDKKVVEEYGVELVDLETLFGESDVITIHSPLTSETKHMFNDENFKKMKDNAILINTSRGPLINEKDLYEALKNNVIAGAAVDVTEAEPIEEDNPLLSLENYIVTPHAAFFTQDSYIELRERAAGEVVRVLSGQEPESRVNK
ncbi:MAG: C-terminal binding protein [Bacillota bacterium]